MKFIRQFQVFKGLEIRSFSFEEGVVFCDLQIVYFQRIFSFGVLVEIWGVNQFRFRVFKKLTVCFRWVRRGLIELFFFCQGFFVFISMLLGGDRFLGSGGEVRVLGFVEIYGRRVIMVFFNLSGVLFFVECWVLGLEGRYIGLQEGEWGC